MHRPRIHEVSHTHLLYVTQSLEPGMGYDVHDLWLRKPEETIDRVINDLDFQKTLLNALRMRVVRCLLTNDKAHGLFRGPKNQADWLLQFFFVFIFPFVYWLVGVAIPVFKWCGCIAIRIILRLIRAAAYTAAV
jgi:hypothetical protein